MRYSHLVSAALFVGWAAAAPAHQARDSVPSTDGFPSPDANQTLDIEQQADGLLSNAPPPAKVANSTLTVFQLVAFNELFETAFFSSVIYNVTNNVTGFNITDAEKRADVLHILSTVLAQEELHAIAANGVLSHFGVFAPPPCQYAFPTTDLASAIALAETFTSVVLGTLQDASQLLAKNGDDGPVRTVASIIGQEGEQNGFFRVFGGTVPSQKPFLTTSVASFAFSVLQEFVVSCPFNITKEIDIPIFPPLAVLSGDGGSNVCPTNQSLSFSANLSTVAAADKYIGGNGGGLYVTYLTGQQLPISEPVANITWDGKVASFDAFFPFDAYVLEGLTLGALTTSNNFSSPDDIPAATLAAPALIQVNDKIESSWA